MKLSFLATEQQLILAHRITAYTTRLFRNTLPGKMSSYYQIRTNKCSGETPRIMTAHYPHYVRRQNISTQKLQFVKGLSYINI